jgi:hypothetical protein
VKKPITYIPVYKYNGSKIRKGWGFWCPSWLSRSPRFLLASCPKTNASNNGGPPAIHAMLNPFATPENSGDSWRNWGNEIQAILYCPSPLNAAINRMPNSQSEFFWFGGGQDDPLASGVKSKSVVSNKLHHQQPYHITSMLLFESPKALSELLSTKQQVKMYHR